MFFLLSFVSLHRNETEISSKMRKHSYEEQKGSLGLPLLKKLEKAKLQDLHDSISAQEYAYKFSLQKKKSLQGLYLLILMLVANSL